MIGPVRMTRNWKIAVAGLVTIVLAVTAVWYGTTGRPSGPAASPFGEAAPAEVTLLPTDADSTGVNTDTAFRLTAVKALSAKAVEGLLTVQPAVAFRAEKDDLLGKEYKIIPAEPLEPGTIYRFRLAAAEPLSRSYQWSFQTKSEFRVLGTLPRNQGSGVPVNTGIEITFSHEDYQDLDGFFTITPAVEGRFERHRKTVAFVPEDPLQPGTIYTVTLKKGLGQKESDGQLGEDYTFAFETQAEQGDKEQAWFYVPSEVQEFTAADTPYFQVGYGAKSGAAATVNVKVWRYGDAAAFIDALARLDRVPWWASYSRGRYEEDPSALKQVSEFTADLKSYPNASGTYLLFPENPGTGYYLAQFSIGAQRRQVHFQVTDLGSYVTVATNQTLVWLHDLQSQEPAKGATVTFPGGAAATADDDGVALLPTPASAARPENHDGIYLVARAGGKESVVTAFPSWYYGDGEQPAARYWRYLYTDRGLYKPDDTLNLFGVIKPRDEGSKPVDRVTVQAVRWDYRSQDDRLVPLVKTELPVEDGLFTGTLQLSGLRPGNYEAQVLLADQVISSTWFEVKTYQKPAYRITATPSQPVLFADQSVDFRVQATFFEGTPVPNLQLQYHLDYASGGALTTDSNGVGAIRFTPRYGSGFEARYGGPVSAWLSLNAVLPEVGEITESASVLVFPHDRSMEVQAKMAGENQASISATVRQVTLERLLAGAPPWDAANWTGAPVSGLLVTGEVEEQNWIREETGEYYDFINKRVVKQYQYLADPKVTERFQVSTDSQGQIVRSINVDPQKQYKITLTAQDSRGRTFTQERWIAGSQYRNPHAGSYRYFWLNTQDEKWQWKLDEEATFAISEDQTPVPDRSRSFLFITARFGIQSYAVQDSALFKTRLKAADLPNTNIAGVYFDGRQYHHAGERALAVDPEERALTVAVRADKESYRPGETVTLDLQVTDKAGKPAVSSVNLNLVDEALFAMRDQSVNLLSSLYGNRVPSGILRWNASHRVPEGGGGAEKGGEGGGVRADFRDAALFRTVITDANGRATVSFQVPDNLTAWRLTYHAVKRGGADGSGAAAAATAGIEAASGTLPIPVKLPFFVDAVLAETFLTGDEPMLSVRTYGSALKPGQPVELSVTVQRPGGESGTTAVKTNAFATLTVPIGKVEPGAYQVTVRGQAGDLTDAMALSFSVVDSYLTQNRVDFYPLSSDTRVAGAAKGPTMLTFADYDRSRYLRLLRELQWQWGNRLEQKLAKLEASRLLKQYFGEDGALPGGADVMAYQTPAGSLAILPYADGELKLSALAADLAAARFDRAGLTTYFQSVLVEPKSDREQIALALYGLAALDEPVLPEIKSLLQAKDLTLSERLYLALALARTGDLEGARPIYYGILKQWGEPVGDNVRINAGTDVDEILSATALTAALGAKLGEAQAAGLVGYLTENRPKEVLLSLEELLAAAAALPNLAAQEPVAFTYMVDGKEERMELKPGESFTLALYPEALATLAFREIEGRVGLAATYPAPLQGSSVTTAPGFSLTVGDSGESGVYQVGEVVRFTINYTIPETAPDGAYEVSAYLPSGLRLVERPWSWGLQASPGYFSWPLEVSGQKVSFWAVKSGDPIEYFARVVAPGEFTVEQMTISHQQSGIIYAISPRGRASIR